MFSVPRWFHFRSDHLGSTLALGCHKQTNGCADRTIYRYYRYGAYGQMKAYTPAGALITTADSPTDRMYTGQVWDAAAQMYYYNARFYDPKAARFLTMDPVREYMSPYAYVAWNPVAYVDPTGMVLGFSGVFNRLNSYMGTESIALLGYADLLRHRGSGEGGMNGPGGGGPGGGTAHGLSPSLQAAIEARIESQLQYVNQLAEAQGEANQQTVANPVPSSLATQGHRVESPHYGMTPSSGLTATAALSPTSSFQNALMALAGAATAASMLATGGALLQAGVGDFGHVAGAIGRQLATPGMTGGLLGASLTGLAMMADGTLMVAGGATLVFGGGLIVGAAIDQAIVAPHFDFQGNITVFEAADVLFGK